MSVDTIKLKGFAVVEIEDADGNRKVVYNNTVTNAGKQLILARSVGRLLSNSMSLFGDGYGIDCLTGNYVDGDASYLRERQLISTTYKEDYMLTNVLLNLGEGTAKLSGDMNYLDIKDDDFSVGSKLVGYANSSIDVVGDTKQGDVDYTEAKYIADPFVITNRWKYDMGIATGTIDTLAMMSADSFKNMDYDGFRYMKCISKVNSEYRHYGGIGNQYCPPGIPGLTANNEVLLNFDMDGKNRWRYNIETGSMDEVPEGEPFWVAHKDVVDIQVYGDYLYALVLKEDYYNHSFYNPRLSFEIRSLSDMSLLKEVVIYVGGSGGSSSIRYYRMAKFLMWGGQLYIKATSDSSNTVPNLFTLGKGSDEYWSKVEAEVVGSYSDIGIDVGSIWDEKNILLGNYGDQYIIYKLSGDSFKKGAVGWVVDDLVDIRASGVTKVFPALRTNSVVFKNNDFSGVLQVGTDSGTTYRSDTSSYAVATLEDRTQSRRLVESNNGTKVYDTRNDGIYLSLDSWGSNVLSYIKLPEPIEKEENHIMWVSYGYKIE